MKFDGELFRILKHSQPDETGFIASDRAFELMDKGYLEHSKKEIWLKEGHKTTKKGTRLYNKWLKQIKDNHGHEWETHKDSNEINIFAYSNGNHNGPRCKRCGFSFCHHCSDEWNIKKCKGFKYEKIKKQTKIIVKHLFFLFLGMFVGSIIRDGITGFTTILASILLIYVIGWSYVQGWKNRN